MARYEHHQRRTEVLIRCQPKQIVEFDVFAKWHLSTILRQINHNNGALRRGSHLLLRGKIVLFQRCAKRALFLLANYVWLLRSIFISQLCVVITVFTQNVTYKNERFFRVEMRGHIK
jgi:hypothetical protein